MPRYRKLIKEQKMIEVKEEIDYGLKLLSNWPPSALRAILAR